MEKFKKVKTPDGSTSKDVVLRLSDGAFIPCDPENSDYQEYLKWLEAGNVPDEADSDPSA